MCSPLVLLGQLGQLWHEGKLCFSLQALRAGVCAAREQLLDCRLLEPSEGAQKTPRLAMLKSETQGVPQSATRPTPCAGSRFRVLRSGEHGLIRGLMIFFDGGQTPADCPSKLFVQGCPDRGTKSPSSEGFACILQHHRNPTQDDMRNRKSPPRGKMLNNETRMPDC